MSARLEDVRQPAGRGPRANLKVSSLDQNSATHPMAPTPDAEIAQHPLSWKQITVFVIENCRGPKN